MAILSSIDDQQTPIASGVRRILARMDLEVGDDADDDFLDGIDSLLLLRLVLELERDFSIRITNEELGSADIGSVDRICRLVARKLHQGGATVAPEAVP